MSTIFWLDRWIEDCAFCSAYSHLFSIVELATVQLIKVLGQNLNLLLLQQQISVVSLDPTQSDRLA